MTVQELITALRAFPPEWRVLVDGYEFGFQDPHVHEANAFPVEEDGGYAGDWGTVEASDGRDDYGRERSGPTERVVIVSRHEDAPDMTPGLGDG